MGQYRRILHASDFSRASTGAFRHAVALAREHRATLILVHVVPEVMPLMVTPEIGAVSAPETYRMIRASALSEAKASLDRLVVAAGGAGVRARVRVVEGVAHERIVQAARRERVDLIVMGTHGRSGLSRLFLGSVAARVAALAPCPVVTIRAGARVRRRMATRSVARRRAA
jgi:nucleotide-binding universal stress UspA family protein